MWLAPLICSYSVLSVFSSGFIKGEEGELPQHIQFEPKFENGALLTVVSSLAEINS